jgi:hypothetical protein
MLSMLTWWNMLISLLSLAALSLLTAALRLVFVRADALWTQASQENGTTFVLEPNRGNRLGWVSFAAALLGHYLPWILLGEWIGHQNGVLDNPDMDDWEQGPGLICLYLCKNCILWGEAAALCCGLYARRTAPGLTACVLALAVIYGITHHWLDDWYLVATHF